MFELFRRRKDLPLRSAMQAVEDFVLENVTALALADDDARLSTCQESRTVSSVIARRSGVLASYGWRSNRIHHFVFGPCIIVSGILAKYVSNTSPPGA